MTLFFFRTQEGTQQLRPTKPGADPTVGQAGIVLVQIIPQIIPLQCVSGHGDHIRPHLPQDFQHRLRVELVEIGHQRNGAADPGGKFIFCLAHRSLPLSFP